MKVTHSHTHIKMQPRIQTEHLHLLLFASLIDYANALPQTVQARPAVVVDRDQSYVSSTVKWVQQNLFYTLLGVGTSCSIAQRPGLNADRAACIVVLIFFVMKYWRNHKSKKTAKTTAAQDRVAEQKAAEEHAAGQNKAWDGFFKWVTRPYTRKP